METEKRSTVKSEMDETCSAKRGHARNSGGAVGASRVMRVLGRTGGQRRNGVLVVAGAGNCGEQQNTGGERETDPARVAEGTFAAGSEECGEAVPAIPAPSKTVRGLARGGERTRVARRTSIGLRK